MATLKLDIPGLTGGDDQQQQQPAAPPPPPPPLNFAQFASNPLAQQKVSAMIPGLPPPPPPQVASATPPPVPPVRPASPPPAAPAPPMAPAANPPASASPSPMQSFQQWQTANPQLQEKPLSGVQKALQIAAGIVGGGVPGAAQAGMQIHQHDLPAGLNAIDLQRYQQGVVQPAQTALALQDTASQINQRQGAANASNAKATNSPLQLAAQLASHGLKQTDDGNVAPDETSPVYQQQQAKLQYVKSQEDLNAARENYQRAAADAKTNPNNPTLQLRRQALAIALKNAQTAAERVGLSTLEYNMHAYGVGGNGQALPGAPLIPGPEGDESVGTAFQHNVVPTGDQRTAAGRAQTMQELQSKIQQQLQDPEIRQGLGPLAGRVSEGKGNLGMLSPKMAQFRNDLVSYGAFQAGLHPVRGIGALQYFDKVMGGLGQTPEQLEGKLASNQATAQQVQKVGVPRVANGRGGVAPSQGQPSSVIYARDPQGKLHQAPAGTPLPQGWKQESR